MKRKILVSILVLSLSASFAGCQTSSTVESNAPSTSKTEVHTDTEVKRPNGSDTDTDSVIEKSESISTDDIKEIKEETTDTAEDTDKDKAVTPNPSSIDVGGITLEAEIIPFDSKLKVSDMEDIDSTVFGDTLYILDKKNLRTYTVTDSSVIKENDIKLDNKYERVDADAYGNIYLSDSKFNAAMLNDDGTVTEIDLTGKLAMSKVMNFGLSCSGKDVIRKYVDGEIEEWLLENIDTDNENNADTDTESDTDKNTDEKPRFTKISDIEFVGNHILVGGKFNDGKDTLRAAVFDYDGNQTALTDNKISGDDIISMTETDNGIIVSTGSNLSLWQSDGTEIGQTKSSETAVLFGTENPVWINDVFAMDDGSALVLCSGENDKGEANALLYKIWGF